MATNPGRKRLETQEERARVAFHVATIRELYHVTKCYDAGAEEERTETLNSMCEHMLEVIERCIGTRVYFYATGILKCDQCDCKADGDVNFLFPPRS